MQIVTTDTFDKEVLQSDKPTFVLFTTPSAIKSYLLEEFLGKIDTTKYKAVKVDVEESYPLNVKYSIRVVPSVWLFSGGIFISSKTLRDIFKTEDIENMVTL